MARLVTSGGEIRDHPTADVGSPDGVAAGAAMCATDTATFRSGLAAIRCPGTSSNSSYRWWPFAAPALGQSAFSRAYRRVSALPASTVKIGAFVTAADAALVSVRLTAAGKLQLWNDAAGTQIGSDSALTVEVDRWFRYQLRLKVGAGAVDEAELLVKSDDYQAVDESVSGASLTVSDTHASRFRAGWIDAPGVTSNMWLDDVAVNDSTGTKQTSFPGEGSVVVAPAAALTSAGSWTDCAGGTGQIAECLNNEPPIGLADHSTAGHAGATAHQTRVGVNTAQTLQVPTRPLASVGMETDLYLLDGSSTSITFLGQVVANTRRAQSFVIGTPLTVDAISLRLGKQGSPTDNLIVEVQSDSAGLPSGTVLASGSIAGSSLAGGNVVYRVPLAAATPLTPGTVYWVVVRRSGAIDGTNYYQWIRYLTNAYSDGAPAVHDGTSWLQSGTQHSVNDHSFALNTTQGVKSVSVALGAWCHGEAVTGVKAGAGQVTAPTSASKAFNFGNDVGVAGTYPSNWRWAQTDPLYESPLSSTTSVSVTKNSGSGSNNFVGLCFMGAIFEYTRPPLGWSRWQKTADSTFHWAKFCPNQVDFETTGGLKTVPPGDWAIYPEPQIAEGEDFPGTLASITDTALKAGYTLV